MNDLGKKLEELKKRHEELQKKAKELDEEILNNPHIPDSIKNYLRSNRTEERKYDVTDGLMMSNKIIGYDPETFEPIYETKP